MLWAEFYAKREPARAGAERMPKADPAHIPGWKKSPTGAGRAFAVLGEDA
jgi:hypothetical protein